MILTYKATSAVPIFAPFAVQKLNVFARPLTANRQNSAQPSAIRDSLTNFPLIPVFNDPPGVSQIPASAFSLYVYTQYVLGTISTLQPARKVGTSTVIRLYRIAAVSRQSAGARSCLPAWGSGAIRAYPQKINYLRENRRVHDGFADQPFTQYYLLKSFLVKMAFSARCPAGPSRPHPESTPPCRVPASTSGLLRSPT